MTTTLHAWGLPNDTSLCPRRSCAEWCLRSGCIAQSPDATMHGPSRRLTDPHTWRIPRRQAPGGYGRTGQDAGRREADHDLTRLKLWTACFGLPFIWAGQKARCCSYNHSSNSNCVLPFTLPHRAAPDMLHKIGRCIAVQSGV